MPKILGAACAHETAMNDWRFADHLTTGKGVCVLFDGTPGTGKTFAAEVLVNELHRSLKRVHMPNLVCEWVGKTGENISQFAHQQSRWGVQSVNIRRAIVLIEYILNNENNASNYQGKSGSVDSEVNND